ncbi:hypothetical protein ES708_33998 [subsurface metagenome]
MEVTGVTNEVFLWVNGILIFLILAFLGSLWKIRGEIAPLCQIAKKIQAKALDDWLEKRDLDTTGLSNVKGGNKTHNSLPPEKEAERGSLTAKGKSVGLTQTEATRLKRLLEEDARNDFANGLMNLVAFAALLVLIGAIVNSLLRE